MSIVSRACASLKAFERVINEIQTVKELIEAGVEKQLESAKEKVGQLEGAVRVFARENRRRHARIGSRRGSSSRRLICAR